MKRKIEKFVNQHKKEVIAIGVLIFSLSIFLITNAFAALTPIKSVIISSRNTSFEKNEPGSWQIEKSGKWISKGKARVTFDVDTTLLTEDKNTDIIMVLDISGSMAGDKFDRVKQDSTELIESLLSNQNNQVALITFDTKSTIVSDFTNDKDSLVNQINSLQDVGSTNYYQALVNVDTILQEYQKTDDKEVIVLFLTDGYPNENIPNQIAQFEYLKKQYPYITVNGIQYEMGDTILDPIKEISDNQYFADMKTLNNVLFDASVAPIPYDEFQIVDYVDNRYFTLDSEKDITVSQGKVKLTEESGKQKITWTITHFNSGRNAKLTMDLNLKDEYIGQGGIYPTNDSEEIISSIQRQKEDVNSTLTPVLADNYQVIYDGNAPDGCTVNNVPDSLNYFVFDTVSISTEQPSCVGYQFKGWAIVNQDVTRVGEDYFIMPEENVTIRAKWAKVTIAKSMDGIVNTMGDPVMKRYTSSTTTDYHNSKYKSKITSIVTKDNLDIPTSAIEYWDVSAAGDGSVIAYVEDDGTGNGTYKVTIGGQGEIIANPDSSYLFSDFINLENIDLNYLDTSQVTDMSRMFYDLRLLTSLDVSNFDTSNVTTMYQMFGSNTAVVNSPVLESLDLSSFDTSKVTNMSAMFLGQRKLKNLNLSSFNTINVTDMSSMFRYCNDLSIINVNNFDTSNVVDMSHMFEQCESIINLDLNNFNTSSVTNMSYMFSQCELLTNLNVSLFDTSKVTQMDSMFFGCSSLTNLDVSGFDTSNVTNMQSMFSSCSGLTNLDVSHFDTSKVTKMKSMFSGCSSLGSLDVSNFNTSNVTDMSYMFSSCSSLTNLDLSNFDTSNVTDMSSMFRDCSSLINLDVSNFDTSNVTFMGSTDSYQPLGMFSGCESLVSLDLSSWNTSNVIGMGFMFSNCKNLTNIVFGENFDTLNVTTMSHMFSDCSSLTSLDLSDFDTSNVTSMSYMFSDCSSLTSLDLSDFDTSNVKNMSFMFRDCSRLTSLDMRNADFSSVTSYAYMFRLVNSTINVIVKDGEAQSFIRARLDDDSRPDATVTIAGSGTQMSYRFSWPSKFKKSFLNLYAMKLSLPKSWK